MAGWQRMEIMSGKKGGKEGRQEGKGRRMRVRGESSYLEHHPRHTTEAHVRVESFKQASVVLRKEEANIPGNGGMEGGGPDQGW